MSSTIQTQKPDENIQLERFRMIIELLSEQPMTAGQLAKAIGVSADTIWLALDTENQIKQLGMVAVEKIQGLANQSFYYLAESIMAELGKSYFRDFNYKYNIENIPIAFFRDLQPIRRWLKRVPNNDVWGKMLVSNFESLCYGKKIPGYTTSPLQWNADNWDEQVVQLVNAWNKAYPDRHMPPVLVRSIRTFIVSGLGINDPQYFRRLKLVTVSGIGKHKSLGLTDAQFKAAIDWLASDELEKTIRSIINTSIESNIKEAIGEVRAHYAFSISGVCRPSALLHVLIENIQLQPDKITWRMLETKTEYREGWYQKIMVDPQLISWAKPWVQQRIFSNHRFLFLNDNTFTPRQHITGLLKDHRAFYSRIYQVMWRALEITDSMFYTDTLYTFRKLSASYHYNRYLKSNTDSMSALAKVKKMGWVKVDTLLNFYLDLSLED